MKKTITLSLLAAAAGFLSAQQAADRFTATRTRIETLLNPRLKADPLPEKPANPFEFVHPGAVIFSPTGTAPTQPVSDVLVGDDQILAYGVSRLRITGLVLRAGVSHLLINASTYRDGDLIPVRGAGEAVYYIRLMRITDREVTFRYNEATATVPLPN